MNDSGVHGLLNLCKPAGMTSRDVVDAVCRAADTGRVGHAGTLDPLATGVLVLCVGWTTRLISCIQEQRKTYRAEFLLGKRSDTDDVTGQVQEVAFPTVPARSDMEAALAQFVGTIEQVPPQYSAVRVGGRRAHQQARRGNRVEIPARRVEVYRIDLLAYEFPRLSVEIECGSGMYVRSIGRDIGELLGCGAVMCNLVRSRIGEFDIDSALELGRLCSETLRMHLLPPTMAVSHLPQHRCTADEAGEIVCGRVISAAGLSNRPGDQRVALIAPDGSLLALAECDGDLLRPRQVFAGPARIEEARQ